MSAILLVRHGQASFGKSDYDALSDLGERQSRVLGRSLAARGVQPAMLLSGGMRRHRQSLEHAVEAAGWSAPTSVDEGWDEFDHEEVIARYQPAQRSQMGTKTDLAHTMQSRKAFQAMFESATRRWASGKFDEDYPESFPTFTTRVREALQRTASRLDAKQTVVVFTSGGPIAAVAAATLDPSGVCGPQLWGTLNIVMINSAVTKVIVGGRGQSLVSVNDHSHLEAADPELLTYR